MPSSAKEIRDGSVDFRSIIHLLRDQAWIVGLCAVLGAGAALVYSLCKPPVYASQAILEVTVDGSTLADFGRREGSDLNSASLLKTIEQTVASQAVLRRVLHKQRLAEYPAFAPSRSQEVGGEAELLELLQNRVSVSLIRGTRLISLVARDRDPVKARQLAQGVVDEFLTQKFESSLEGTDATRRYLTAEATRLKDEVTAAEERLQLYREKFNAVSLTDKHDLVTGRLSELGRQVTQARARRVSMEADRLQVQTLRKEGPEALVNLSNIAALPEIVDLRKQINTLSTEVAALSQRYREKHPRMIEITRELQEAHTALQANLQQAGEAILQSYLTAKTNEEMLQKELYQQEKLALELARVTIPYRALEREAESNQVLYQQVLARLKESVVAQGMITKGSVQGSYIRVIQQPLAPVKPGGMSAKSLLALGLAGGGALGMCLAVGRRALDNSLSSIDEAETYLDLPSLAVVQRSSFENLRHDLVVDSSPASIEAESFRSLRTTLSLLQPDENGRVVMFTSAVQGEGKSFCAMNYAAGVAEQGLRTLLVDGDLRRAWLRHALAPASEKPGLVACLRNPALIDEAINPTETKNLFVLGDLHGSTEGAELLEGENLGLLIQRLRERFDRIIIDTAPVTAVCDALHFSRHVGTICLVVNARSTPRRTVRRACVMLEHMAGRHPSGIVLNQVRRGRAGSYYYYSNNESRPEPRHAAPVRAAMGFLRSLGRISASRRT